MTEGFAAASLSDYDRSGFLAFVRRIAEDDFATENESDAALLHFNEIVPHPAKSDLIYWPPEDIRTPEDIVAEIERYCRENGLQGLKNNGTPTP